MAEPVDFEGANDILGAPPSMPDCYDLPIFRTPMQIISCWRLTPAELEEVSRTGVVWFSAAAPTHPAILISGNALVEINGRPAKAEPIVNRKERDNGQVP